MSVINIRPVQSGQSRAVIGIAGISGSGKTYTALKIARGMVEKSEQIGFLDTENKRGSLYADILDGKFLIGDLYPPFTPERYSQAIKQFQDAGVKVLVIDSITHEWEGEGGCEDIANAPLKLGKKMANWIGAKREHKSFMNTLLQSDMDIICCIRAREKTDFTNPTQPVSLGIQPICEKNFMFEMTASLLMENVGKNQKFLKIPSFLKESFGSGVGYLGIETGKKIREWLDNGEKESPEIEKLKSEALLICEKGSDALTNLWNSLTKEQKSKLRDHFALCGESAKAYDKLNSDESEEKETITFESLNKLYSEVEESLTEDEKINAKRILKEKESTSYDKLETFLKSKKTA